MRFDDLTRRLAETFGGEPLPTDGEGRIELAFEGGLIVHLWPAGRGQVIIDTRLEALPEAPAERERALRKALERSLARLRDHPEILALDEASGQLHLYRKIDIDKAEFASFSEALAEFLDIADLWRGRTVERPRMAPPPLMIFP